MAQSLETRVTDLINEITELKQRYEQYPDVFDERLEQFTASFQNTIDNLDAGTIYLDRVAGDDGNDGGARDRAVATLQAAIARVPQFGGGEIRLLSDYYLGTDVYLSNRHVEFSAEGGSRLIQGSPDGSGSGSVYCRGSVRITTSRMGFATAAGDAGLFVASDTTSLHVRQYVGSVVLGGSPLVAVSSRAVSALDIAHDGVDVSFGDGVAGPVPLIKARNAVLLFSTGRGSLPANTSWADIIDSAPGAAVSNVL